jgi:hypothetical protein
MIPPPLAHPDFWEKQSYPTFVKFWGVCNRLLDALNKFTLNAGKAKDKNETIIRFLCLSTGISFADVGMLVGNGFGLSAMKIARTCFESASMRNICVSNRPNTGSSWIGVSLSSIASSNTFGSTCRTNSPV